MKELIPILALGVAAFFGYRWWTTSQEEAEPTTTEDTGAGEEDEAEQPPTRTETPTGSATDPRLRLTLKERLTLAAADVANAYLVAKEKLNADQWNFYRKEATGMQITQDIFPPGNRGYLMTAEEYHARLAAHGLLQGLVLRGLGNLRRKHMGRR